MKNFSISFMFFISILNLAMAQDKTPTKTYHAFELLNGTLQTEETTNAFCDDGKFNERDYSQLIHFIGWVYPINCKIHVIKTSEKGDAFNVTYKINNLGQRILPQTPGVKKKHLIVAGDSNVFGQGVADTETTPYLLGQKYPDYHTYNWGHRGGGPNNTLALMENEPWSEEIKEQDGRMIYVYYPSWMAVRVYGSKDYLTISQGKTPWYELDNDSQLVYKGNMREKWISKLFLLINFIDRFHWVGDLPKLNIDHIKLTSKIFIKMKHDYENKFPSGKFTLVVSDYLHIPHTLVPELIKMVKDAGVEVIEINKIKRQKNPEIHLFDEHFNLKGQQMIRDDISKEIKF